MPRDLVVTVQKPKPREQITLMQGKIVELSTKFEAMTFSGEKELLRIYWYDGAPSSGQSLEQANIAQA